MKKISLLFTALLITVVACDKIDTTTEVFKIMSPVEVSPWDPNYAATVVQKIYIEEFTGHACTYCPNGARELHAMMTEDPNIIATAIHCSNQANPNPYKDGWKNNYKTPMGNAIESDFNIKGLPKAMINRTKYESNDWGIAHTSWRNAVAAINRKNVRAGIQLECTVSEANKEVIAKVSVTTIKEIPNPVQICLILQQDRIISGQIDNGVDIPDYEHNHMLRGGFNGNYGARLTPSGNLAAEIKYSTTFKISYANPFPLSSFQTEIRDCVVVAYLIDMVTKEVIQVEKFELY